MYSKKVIEHFTRPHNQGKIFNPDGVGIVGNPVCGDLMKLYIKIKKDKNKPPHPRARNYAGGAGHCGCGGEKEIITDVKFETLGCASAIATSSMITDLAKGKSIEEAKKITRDDVAEALEGLPPIKMHCSNLASDALREAINDYYNKRKGKADKK